MDSASKMVPIMLDRGATGSGAARAENCSPHSRRKAVARPSTLSQAAFSRAAMRWRCGRSAPRASRLPAAMSARIGVLMLEKRRRRATRRRADGHSKKAWYGSSCPDSQIGQTLSHTMFGPRAARR